MFTKPDEVEKEKVEMEEDLGLFREGIVWRLVDRDVLFLTGIWLFLFWSGFVLGAGICYWIVR